MSDDREINIVLAGQANAGKSVIFNFLTGLHQHIGNWAGKTVEKREGTLIYRDYTVNVLDLPGIYSLTTYSSEEVISREYIIHHNPDCVVNIIDSTNLERNLIFTLQLLELECPIILVVNMIDLAKKKGVKIDFGLLQHLMKVPVIPTIATRGYRLTDIIDKAIELKESGKRVRIMKYGKEIEYSIEQLVKEFKDIRLSYPARWLAIKLLEKDADITEMIRMQRTMVTEIADNLRKKLEDMHGHDSAIVVADERSHLAARITQEIVEINQEKKITLSNRIDFITTHKLLGYIMMAIILGGMFLFVFKFGNIISTGLDMLVSDWHTWWNNNIGLTFLASLGWSAIEGVIALIQIALPYILPFYIILYFLEDWGYIARISFLMDNLMHKMGIHGKACISFIIGFGCNVPGCLSCRIMESGRERFITAVLVTLVPCSAVSVIIFGLVGKFVGILWAFVLYLVASLLIFIVGKLASIFLKGESMGLIMPMPDYKTPHFRTVFIQTWHALKEFIYIAAPLVIISGVFIQAINLAGWMPAITSVLNPITEGWLGLPAITGVILIFGILRKELILVMLAAYLGSDNLSTILTAQQMITLAILSMFYIPCIATISVLWKDYGWKKAMAICIMEIMFAIILAGIVKRILDFIPFN